MSGTLSSLTVMLANGEEWSIKKKSNIIKISDIVNDNINETFDWKRVGWEEIPWSAVPPLFLNHKLRQLSRSNFACDNALEMKR